MFVPFPGGREDQYDEIFVWWYGWSANGRQQLPINTHLYNKFVGEMFAYGFQAVKHPARLRNMRIGHPAVADRLHIGEVVRCDSNISIHNVMGRGVAKFACLVRRCVYLVFGLFISTHVS